MSGHEAPPPVEESEIERLRNTLMGLALVCTVMVCVTAIACAVILS